MTQPNFIILALVLVTISAVVSTEPPKNSKGKDDEFQCDTRNAMKTDCATNCDVDWCPVSDDYSRVCDKQECTPGCKCGFNEKFARNGTCISTQQCPPFRCDARPNEEYVACPSYCSDSCSQRNCPVFGFILMVVDCSPACKCRKGFYRKDGICVPSEEC